jgi:hypothetical protein
VVSQVRYLAGPTHTERAISESTRKVRSDPLDNLILALPQSVSISHIAGRMSSLRWTVAALLLQLASTVAAHGHDDGTDGMDMDMDMGGTKPSSEEAEYDPYNDPSYAGLSAHSGMMLAHIGLMVLAWLFILPVGK